MFDLDNLKQGVIAAAAAIVLTATAFAAAAGPVSVPANGSPAAVETAPVQVAAIDAEANVHG